MGLDHMLVAGKGMIVENELLDRKLSSGVLGELFEAVLGAVFVDGGIGAARHAYVKNFPLERELERMKKEQ
jgi:dsRNA-specific ribonuclease